MKNEQVQPTVVYVEKQSSNGLAAVMSFFIPGLGQLYQGRVGMGFALLALFVVTLPTFVFPIIFWGIGIADALTHKPKNTKI